MELPSELNDAEKKLLASLADGTGFECTTGDPEKDDPAHGATWGEERTIRAEVIRAVCVGSEHTASLDPKGICVRGARIRGLLDLEGVSLSVPLRLVACHVESQVMLRDASVKLLDFQGSVLARCLDCTGAVFERALLLRERFVCNGVANLLDARINGFLDCSGATFDSANDYANPSRLHVREGSRPLECVGR